MAGDITIDVTDARWARDVITLTSFVLSESNVQEILEKGLKKYTTKLVPGDTDSAIAIA